MMTIMYGGAPSWPRDEKPAEPYQRPMFPPDAVLVTATGKQVVSASWDGKTLRVKVTQGGHVVAEAETEGGSVNLTVSR